MPKPARFSCTHSRNSFKSTGPYSWPSSPRIKKERVSATCTSFLQFNPQTDRESFLLEGRTPSRPQSCLPFRSAPDHEEMASTPENAGRRHPVHWDPLEKGNRSSIIFLTICTKDRQPLLPIPNATSFSSSGGTKEITGSPENTSSWPTTFMLFCAPRLGVPLSRNGWPFGRKAWRENRPMANGMVSLAAPIFGTRKSAPRSTGRSGITSKAIPCDMVWWKTLNRGPIAGSFIFSIGTTSEKSGSGRSPTLQELLREKKSALLVADGHFEPLHHLEQVLPDLPLLRVALVAQQGRRDDRSASAACHRYSRNFPRSRSRWSRSARAIPPRPSRRARP